MYISDRYERNETTGLGLSTGCGWTLGLVVGETGSYMGKPCHGEWQRLGTGCSYRRA